METFSTSIGQQNLLLPKRIFETLHQSVYRNCHRPVAICCMACFAAYLFNFCCICSFALAGVNSKKQKEILLADLCYDVHLECGYHLVDMECIASGSYRCVCSQQLYHVPALARF